MSAPADAMEGLPLHAVWWLILKPRALVLANGQPAFDIAGQFETLIEATVAVRTVPGGRIVQNTVVFVNPKNLPPAIRNQ